MRITNLSSTVSHFVGNAENVRGKLAGGWKKLREEPQLYFSPNISMKRDKIKEHGVGKACSMHGELVNKYRMLERSLNGTRNLEVDVN